MLTMQAFHNQLFAASTDRYFQSLARLTEATLAQLKAFKSELAWSEWA